MNETPKAESKQTMVGRSDQSTKRGEAPQEFSMSLLRTSFSTAEYRQISKAVREACGQSGKPYPIEDVDGFQAPSLVGESYYWTTRGGRRIYHRSAYARKGWSNIVYSPSTLAIQVGRGWLIQQGLV